MSQSFPPQSFEDIQAYYRILDLIQQTLSEKEREPFCRDLAETRSRIQRKINEYIDTCSVNINTMQNITNMFRELEFVDNASSLLQCRCAK
jgi:hypothetical protein